METKMTDMRTDKVNQILERKNDAYAEFLSVTVLLKKALEDEDMAAVAGLIAQRAALIGLVDGLDREMGPGQRTGPYDGTGGTAWITAAMPAGPDEKLRQILFANRDCHAIAADRLSQLRKGLTVIHEKEGGLHGYIRHVEQIPKFLNVRT
jgi:hypothetical protein